MLSGGTSPCFPAIPSASKAQVFQIVADRVIQLRRFLLLLPPLRAQSLHLVGKGLAVVIGGLGADIAPGGEHMAVLADFLQRRGLAKSGDVLVGAGLLLTTPSMVGIGDLLDVGIT